MVLQTLLITFLLAFFTCNKILDVLKSCARDPRAHDRSSDFTPKTFAVAGNRVRSVRMVFPGSVSDITNSLAKRSYPTEREFITALDDMAKPVDYFEIDWGTTTRIYHPANHPKMLGLDTPLEAPPVKRAFVRMPLLFNHVIDVTDRINKCAGPRGDFYTGIGGYVRPVDVWSMIGSWMWYSVHVEWSRPFGPSTVSVVGKNDVLTTPGKLYPVVHPFVPIKRHAATSLWKKLKRKLP
jgi:hypothetical protein